ncbi:H-NS histone family protein [Rugamonas sp.]|uniref:H-NS histone family protein n=1 Tax=Rugamonas sp. TaxID=1926287 RepID=UPI0025E8B046|nr:H-NS histone family protein [Rugamonas sp.]
MSTYAKYAEEIAKLKALAETARQNEIAEAKTQIHAIMQQYGLTVSDLQTSGAKGKAAKTKASVAVKYKNSETGATWTGRGRAPLWLQGKDKADYLVK